MNNGKTVGENDRVADDTQRSGPTAGSGPADGTGPPQAPSNSGAGEQPVMETAALVEDLKRQLDEANQRVLRAQADLENFRRRMRRDVEEELKYATKALLSDLLPVVDNIQRAIEATEQHSDIQGLREGVRMVAQQLVSVLEKHHCSVIPAEGQPFDPRFHEAVAQQPSNEHPPGTVLKVHQQGYQLHDRVLRPVQVTVSSKSDQESDEDANV